MKVIFLFAFASLAHGASLTYSSSPLTNLDRERTSFPNPKPEFRSHEVRPRVTETVHQETGDALGNRVGGFVTRDGEGNIRTFRYTSTPNDQLPEMRHHQNAFDARSESASGPSRYGYGLPSRSSSFAPATAQRFHSVTFTAPLADTHSYYPQFPLQRNY